MNANQAILDRQRAFEEFTKAVFNVLKLALARQVCDDLLREIERDVALVMNFPGVRDQMRRYCEDISIKAAGFQKRTGWPWRRWIFKNISVDIVFEPYQMSLTAWTNRDGSISCFR